MADAEAAWCAAADFADEAAAVIVKHANPCGIAAAAALADAYESARLCDPLSAFGGVIALTRAIDAPTAEAIAAVFTEVVIAPAASDEALRILAAKPDVRVLLTGGPPEPGGTSVRSIGGGLLVQDGDHGTLDTAGPQVVTDRVPTEAEWFEMRFAWRAVKHVKSNAIVYARGNATVGIGAGQMSRVDAARIATWKAAEAASAAGEAEARTTGAAAASDAFFPFADGLEVIADAGATAVIQPGGSRRDDEVIATADRRGLAMVFTGMRHFRH
jgi:phosphoribosylaminoimidazolecarboxamide formyltransferase/IMP cyclohydrolase